MLIVGCDRRVSRQYRSSTPSSGRSASSTIEVPLLRARTIVHGCFRPAEDGEGEKYDVEEVDGDADVDVDVEE